MAVVPYLGLVDMTLDVSDVLCKSELYRTEGTRGYYGTTRKIQQVIADA